jgi:hypothetical protein
LITISEFAKVHSVSVQTVYRKLNKVKHFHGDSLTEKKNGIAYITAEGAAVLSDCLTGVKQENDKVFNPVKQDVGQDESEEVLFLREQVNRLQGELAKEREYSHSQSEQMAELAGRLADLSYNHQILLGMEQKAKTGGWFRRLFTRAEK